MADPTPERTPQIPDWNTMPRLLQELCDGHPQICGEVYAYDEDGHRSWLCKPCWQERAHPAVRVDLSSTAAARLGLTALIRRNSDV